MIFGICGLSVAYFSTKVIYFATKPIGHYIGSLLIVCIGLIHKIIQNLLQKLYQTLKIGKFWNFRKIRSEFETFVSQKTAFNSSNKPTEQRMFSC